jgi:hypothetical protein
MARFHISRIPGPKPTPLGLFPVGGHNCTLRASILRLRGMATVTLLGAV